MFQEKGRITGIKLEEIKCLEKVILNKGIKEYVSSKVEFCIWTRPSLNIIIFEQFYIIFDFKYKSACYNYSVDDIT